MVEQLEKNEPTAKQYKIILEERLTKLNMTPVSGLLSNIAVANQSSSIFTCFPHSPLRIF